MTLFYFYSSCDRPGFNMEDLYETSGITRQAFHQWLNPSKSQRLKTSQEEVLEIARAVRKKYLPGSGSRVIYNYIRSGKCEEYNGRLRGWGKHAFERACLKGGMRVQQRRIILKTTNRGDYVFPNLIEGSSIVGINKIWVSDISYIFGDGGSLIGYSTSLLDLYSRMLLGLSFSKTMQATETSVQVLKQAFAIRGLQEYPDLIFHSDGGKQFIEKSFLYLLGSKQIHSSMAETCYENSFAESFNDILKNHMMHDMTLNSFSQLKKQEQFIKSCYNNNRPHGSLNNLTPVESEQILVHLSMNKRVPLLVNSNAI
nr:DDE-type integrase/transposase/recombinase [Saprospiraceae bacterium]